MSEHVAFAGQLAAKLQGAHEARQRQREDQDMTNEATTEQVAQVGSSVWDDDPMVHAMKLVERLGTVLGDLGASGHAPGEDAEQGSPYWKVVRERDAALADVARLQALADKTALAAANRTLQAEADVPLAHQADMDQEIHELRRERDEKREAASLRDELVSVLERKLREADLLLATAYVTREVPWSDVAAGMMTIARDGTPWMVGGWNAARSTVVLANGVEGFEKTPKVGETVRVLVPYVTPEQAEGAVREQLGGRA